MRDMPEGHLIHRLAADHERRFAGRPVRVTSPQGRFEDGAGSLDGRRLDRVEAYGKHLFYWWEDDQVLHVHLGMGGKFLTFDPDAPGLRQARLRLEADGDRRDLVAPITCEIVGAEERDRIVARLGPDPLHDGTDAERVRTAVTASTREVGALVLDQTVIAGVGNVLRAEGLFAAGIHPAVRGRDVSEESFAAFWSALVAMMRRGRDEGRIITSRPPGADPLTLPESEGRYVYKQEHCRRCGTAV
ncbi:MAG TPA: DNA-formamidopyrimidine glycosylase family protein, partial [Actinopolymorphaceae bacterium]